MNLIEISNIRNISSLTFQVPQNGVHIVTGKNGTGKTTLFTCLSRIKNNNAFRTGFPSSENEAYDAFPGTITYIVEDDRVTYSRRNSGEWRPDARNNVLDRFGFSAVINVSTNAKRIFLQGVIQPRRRTACDERLNALLQQVLDDDKFSRMFRITTGDLRRGRATQTEDRRRNTAYAIELATNHYYTERNFSFGEIVLLNLFYEILNAPVRSLLLIDEIELALHPSAQIRLIEALKQLSVEKQQTIIISTHSTSIIRSEKDVILLEREENGVTVLPNCPPAKAIGAIGVREETVPDIVILVEDRMANILFSALKRKYLSIESKHSFLDIRVLEIGGFSNVINFYNEARNYIFYGNIFLAAFMDKDVETDIIPYSQFGNVDLINSYRTHNHRMKFLPYTPEVLLMKTFIDKKAQLLREMRQYYTNQQLDYVIGEVLQFADYDNPFPPFENQAKYNQHISDRGTFRSRCKNISESIVESLRDQTNLTHCDEILRFVFDFAVRGISEQELNIRQYLGPIFNRTGIRN